MLGGLAATAILAFSAHAVAREDDSSCDSVKHGYKCKPEISHYWGQYSPYYSVPSNISARIPDSCSVSFAQILSRHGARDPTASKTKSYNATIQKIQSKVKKYAAGYDFIANFTYTLGADQLTLFGEQQMINSGIKFYNRYDDLASDYTPFVRSAGENRVVVSALNWTQGFHQAKLESEDSDEDYPYPLVSIPEADGVNNTLNHGLCTQFESGNASTVGSSAQSKWVSKFVPPIQARLNQALPGANLTSTETIYLMDLCPFYTVASPGGNTFSQFCSLFNQTEWHQYNYYQSLGKYYGYGFGNPLGPTQGVGFVNELIARLTDKPVQDNTSTNRTLDSNDATFPLGRKLYADFSHDNDMTAILAALGVYNSTNLLPTSSILEAPQALGYSAAWTVPFAARIYVEKLECDEYDDEVVRIIVNDRVVPLPQCKSDSYGACDLSAFIRSLGFARAGGKWAQCFA